ncbi:MerR family transcriptional regulator [Metaclostridioides mangenotii]|uniref:MerR family transcriptional regulator n=1 Tax=Metaclostridioides mangenotii TaxID=1540 RepID=UPI0028EAF2E7|nr:MerR family transcriptional regulator [Clostridioides mangenotii]
MEYTVNKLSKLAGISSRTLRFYDEIELLKPSRVNSSGYRIYGEKEVNKLQQILFYRELGLKLDSIKHIVNSIEFDELGALKDHHKNLIEKKQQIELLLANVEKTIKLKEGKVKMSDKEKFEGFKDKLISENDKKYGDEIREKYGKESIDESYKKFKGMSEDDYQAMDEMSKEILKKLNEAYKIGDPKSHLAHEVADLHRRWLGYTWSSYSKEAHRVLAQMYVDDERFTAYYDRDQPGLAEFLRDAIYAYTE